MIGVRVQESERLAATEFFELFKTPWEFYREGAAYEVVVCSGEPPPVKSLRLSYCSAPLRGDSLQRTLNGQPDPVWADTPEGRLPLYGALSVFNVPAKNSLLSHEGSPAVVRQQTGGQTLLHFGYDLFQEVPFLLTQGQPPACASAPALDLHIALMRHAILDSGIPLVEIPPTPAGYSMSACLTHDVDFTGIRDHGWSHTTRGFLFRALLGSIPRWLRGHLTFRQVLANWWAACSLPFVRLGWLPDFWQEFDRYLEIERGHPSTFFFIPYKGRPGQDVALSHPERRAAAYELKDVRADLDKLSQRGCEAALHGIDAWREPALAREERRHFTAETGQPCAGNRIHWLCFDEQSPRVLDEAGFDYDSTCGYNETIGFKAGTCQAFRPPGTQHLLELPMHLQDVALFYPTSLGLSPAQAWTECQRVIEAIAVRGGVATVLWHNRSLSPERHWGGTYARIIAELERRNAWFGTAAQVTNWFRTRRNVQFMATAFEPGGVRLRMACPQLTGPGLLIRVSRPVARAEGGWRIEQKDIPWTGQGELFVPWEEPPS